MNGDAQSIHASEMDDEVEETMYQDTIIVEMESSPFTYAKSRARPYED